MEIKLSCRLDYCARHLYKLDCVNVKIDCAKINTNVESDCANVKIYITTLNIRTTATTQLPSSTMQMLSCLSSTPHLPFIFI